MRSISRKLALLSAVYLLAACSGLSSVAPKKVMPLSSYSVVSPIHWTRMGGSDRVTWTDDGPQLQYLTFFEPVGSGQPIFKSGAGGSPGRSPRFDPAMTPIEIAEFVVATYTQIGRTKVKASDITPATIGGTPGFRFNMTFTSAAGVDYNGLVAGTVRRERLYLIIYAGARVHYFDKRKSDAEKIIQTVDFGS